MRTLVTTLAAVAAAAASFGTLASTAVAADTCPNAAVRAEQKTSTLAHCRAYELVSPADKSRGQVVFPAGFDGFPAGPSGSTLNKAATDGHAVTYYSYHSFANPTSGLITSYRGARTDSGWTTAPWSPAPASRHADLRSRVRITMSTPDLSVGLIDSNEAFDPLDTDGASFDVFSQRVGGTPEWLSRPNADVEDPDPTSSRSAAISDDGSHVLFETTEPLTDQARTTQVGGTSLYLRHDDVTSMIAAEPGSAPVSTCGSVLGTHNGTGTRAENDPWFPVDRAMTPDGTRVFFSAPDPGGYLTSGDPACSEPSRLYLRDADDIIEVSRSQRTVPGAPAPAIFLGASIDGNRVFFISDALLTDDAVGTGSHLYGYDVPSGRLTLINADPSMPLAGPYGGVVAVSRDGDYVYFLQDDFPDTRLMVWNSGQARVAVPNVTLPGDPGVIRSRLTAVTRDARLSDDGKTLLFLSDADLAGANSDGLVQAFVYNDDSRALSCISCNPRGTPPPGSVYLYLDTANLGQLAPSTPRNLTSDGRRAFFQTTDSLVPQDDNNATDVYEWNGGKVTLVTDGHTAGGSYFFDASDDGRDVFFGTAASLVAQDVDNGDQDLYNARVDGGFASTTKPNVPCDGDSCQSEPTPAPAPTPIGSVGFSGAGDVPPDRKPVSSRKVTAPAKRAIVGSVGTLVVRVPSAGRLKTSGAGLVGTSRSVPGRSSITVKVALTSAGRKALARGSKALERTLRIAFSPANGRVSTATVAVTFKPPASAKRRGSVSSPRKGR